MSVTLLVMTDGRDDLLDQALISIETSVVGCVDDRVIHDDTGDSRHRRVLAKRYAGWRVIGEGPRRGFGGAYRFAWEHLVGLHTRGFVFSTEDDFTFNEPVDLGAMCDVLDRHPHVAQIVLKRQAWNDSERSAGGIIEQNPDEYCDRTDGRFWWCEHRLFWSTNPHLTRRELLGYGWPVGDHSEGLFTHLLLEDPDLRFAFWGRAGDPPRVTHHGRVRAGTGY